MGERTIRRLLIIGGHEDKRGDGKIILRELSRLVGSGRLVIATLASEQPGSQWEEYEATMRSVGVRHLHHLKIESRADAESPAGQPDMAGLPGPPTRRAQIACRTSAMCSLSV